MSKYVLKRKDGIVKEYDFIGYYSEGFAAVRRDGKWGYIDDNGKEICPLQYSLPFWMENDPFPFSEGYAVVIKSTPCPTGDGEVFCGYINTKGEEVCPCKYEAACNFDNGIALVKQKNMKWYVIDKKFQIITKHGYDEIRSFNNGYAAVRVEEKWGFIDANGNEICEIKYDYVGDFGGLGYANIESNNFKKTRLYYIDCAGKEYYAFANSDEFYPLT